MRQLFLAITFLVTLSAQDNFIGDVFEKGSINYGDRTIQAIGIGFIPENVINAGQARRSACRLTLPICSRSSAWRGGSSRPVMA